ncbi:MAG: hypothetical protein KJ720_01260 [Proteobacteria bacterium]|nr:hypothetical protein [Pseudomonadota bacterium]MBU1452627.1 hypothetical protein [Pseudomonadota bacterium]MBU2467761.1 hypothetical protein [Pseudomonadota bacterium]MBU2517888.1 hypothetical protein [Pseudomonadota bacterium]
MTLTAGFAVAASKKDVAEARAELRKMAQETLDRLYKMRPSAKNLIGKADGYAVFSNFGTKILLFGGGAGKGIVFDKKAKQEIFMKMVEAQAGWGFGVKKFRLVLVFEKQKDLKRFVDTGWEFGGQGSAAMKMGEEGGAYAGAISVSPGVWLYQLTDKGLAMELTGKATKYYRDDDLN